jgi:hypothetical protein
MNQVAMSPEELLAHLKGKVEEGYVPEDWRTRLQGDPEARMFIVTRGRRGMVVKVYPDGRHIVGRPS